MVNGIPNDPNGWEHEITRAEADAYRPLYSWPSYVRDAVSGVAHRVSGVFSRVRNIFIPEIHEIDYSNPSAGEVLDEQPEDESQNSAALAETGQNQAPSHAVSRPDIEEGSLPANRPCSDSWVVSVENGVSRAVSGVAGQVARVFSSASDHEEEQSGNVAEVMPNQTPPPEATNDFDDDVENHLDIPNPNLSLPHRVTYEHRAEATRYPVQSSSVPFREPLHIPTPPGPNLRVVRDPSQESYYRKNKYDPQDATPHTVPDDPFNRDEIEVLLHHNRGQTVGVFLAETLGVDLEFIEKAYTKGLLPKSICLSAQVTVGKKFKLDFQKLKREWAKQQTKGQQKALTKNCTMYTQITALYVVLFQNFTSEDHALFIRIIQYCSHHPKVSVLTAFIKIVSQEKGKLSWLQKTVIFFYYHLIIRWVPKSFVKSVLSHSVEVLRSFLCEDGCDKKSDMLQIFLQYSDPVLDSYKQKVSAFAHSDLRGVSQRECLHSQLMKEEQTREGINGFSTKIATVFVPNLPVVTIVVEALHLTFWKPKTKFSRRLKSVIRFITIIPATLISIIVWPITFLCIQKPYNAIVRSQSAAILRSLLPAAIKIAWQTIESKPEYTQGCNKLLLECFEKVAKSLREPGETKSHLEDNPYAKNKPFIQRFLTQLVQISLLTPLQDKASLKKHLEECEKRQEECETWLAKSGTSLQELEGKGLEEVIQQLVTLTMEKLPDSSQEQEAFLEALITMTKRKVAETIIAELATLIVEKLPSISPADWESFLTTCLATANSNFNKTATFEESVAEHNQLTKTLEREFVDPLRDLQTGFDEAFKKTKTTKQARQLRTVASLARKRLEQKLSQAPQYGTFNYSGSEIQAMLKRHQELEFLLSQRDEEFHTTAVLLEEKMREVSDLIMLKVITNIRAKLQKNPKAQSTLDLLLSIQNSQVVQSVASRIPPLARIFHQLSQETMLHSVQEKTYATIENEVLKGSFMLLNDPGFAQLLIETSMTSFSQGHRSQ